MAEFVQQSIEEMLPELQQMERVGLFTKDETRQILKRRKGYEYKLRRRTKCKEDFLQYIQYEINTLGLVKMRREKIGYSFKRLEIDIAIVQRIHRMFRLATIRFKDDIKLWLSHIEFAKERRETATVSRLFTNLLQVHNKKPDLWLLAAKWEFEDNTNPENARGLLQRGLRFNAESKKLWLEYYRMELLYAEKIRKRREVLGGALPEDEGEVTDAILQGDVAQVVYQQALQAVPDDVSFLLSFVPITRLFGFTQKHEDAMFEDLLSKFPSCEETWSALARRCLEERTAEPVQPVPIRHTADGFDEKECRCFEVFEEAVTAVPTELMWTEYLRVCLERLTVKSPGLGPDRRERNVLEVFKRASRARLLSAQCYNDWLDLLLRSGSVEEAECVAAESTQRYPGAVALWRRQLVVLTKALADENRLLQVLHQATKIVPERESWPLWEITLQYLISKNSSSIEKQFQSCTASPVRELCLPAKEMYLQWAALTQGIDKARQVYNRLVKVRPVSLEFHQQFLDIEQTQATSKIKKLREVYENAIQDYGSEDTDLWLDYIRLELSHPKGKSKNAGNIHFRAMKNLSGDLVERFVTQYTLLQTGHNI